MCFIRSLPLEKKNMFVKDLRGPGNHLILKVDRKSLSDPLSRTGTIISELSRNGKYQFNLRLLIRVEVKTPSITFDPKL